MNRDELKLKSLSGRASRVGPGTMWRGWRGDSARDFAASLPDVLAVKGMRAVARAIVTAREAPASRILMYGGHVIKCGLGPLLVDWLERGVFDCISTNGAGSIHDLESSVFGHTSEDVEAGIADGSFGMWRETAELYGSAVELASAGSSGLGSSIGETILGHGGDPGVSPLARAFQLGIPATVHPALGTDIVHPVPQVDWAKLAAAAERDFRTLGDRISGLSGGVVVNAGSAVIMPEVFLKLLVCSRNCGSGVQGFLSANFDMIQHYRPGVNVLERPAKALGGRSVAITGHHEMTLPMLDLMIRALEGAGQ